jgi:hypothetical protein
MESPKNLRGATTPFCRRKVDFTNSLFVRVDDFDPVKNENHVERFSSRKAANGAKGKQFSFDANHFLMRAMFC